MSIAPTISKTSSRKPSLDSGRHAYNEATLHGGAATSSAFPMLSPNPSSKSRTYGEGPMSPSKKSSSQNAKRLKLGGYQSPTRPSVHGEEKHVATSTPAGLQEDPTPVKHGLPAESQPLPRRLGRSSHNNDVRDVDRKGALSQSTDALAGPELANSSISEASVKSWTGNDIEDQLSDQVIKEGFVSKSKVSNEYGTAINLFAHIKSNGLSELSRLVLDAFHERKLNAVTTLSAFKPPPRVTLTDARKIAWFADLANSSIPLRRLSRSIPHGVRGRALLDQCYSHRVPLSRALWLVKCVGANEMRAFKRKGVSSTVTNENEYRWVQSWTSNVLDFLRGTLNDARESEFPVHAVQVVMCLYAEGTIHHEQFLDGIMNDFEACTTMTETMSQLGIVEIWHHEILRQCRHVMSLATNLYKRSLQLQEPTAQSQSTLTNNPLASLLRKTLDSIPTALVDVVNAATLPMLDSADRYEELMHRLNCTRSSSPASKELKLLVQDHRGLKSDQQGLLQRLDICSTHEHYRRILHTFGSHDDSSSCQLIMKWATTNFRAQKGAVCIAERLLHELCRLTPSNKTIILSSLFNLAKVDTTAPDRFSGLGLDLIESGVVDINEYMRELISSGAVYNEAGSRCHLSLLELIPARILTVQTNGIREHLLQGLLESLQATGRQHKDIDDLEARLPTLWKLAESISISEHSTANNQLGCYTASPRAAKVLSTLASCNAAAERVALASSDEAKALCQLLDQFARPCEFHVVLEPVIRAANYPTLFHVTALISTYEVALLVLGHLTSLRDLVIGRYRALRLVSASDPDVLGVLQSLVDKEPWQRQYLAKDASPSEQGQGIAAFTPASDVLVSGDTPKDVHLNKPEDGSVATFAHFRRLASSADKPATSTDMLAALEYLTDSLSRPSGVESSSLSLSLLCWILTVLDDSDEALIRSVHDVCSSRGMRAAAVDAIVHEKELIETKLTSLWRSHPSMPCKQGLELLAYNLLRASEGLHVTRPLDLTHQLHPGGSKSSFSTLVDQTLASADELSAEILKVALSILAHIEQNDNLSLRQGLSDVVGKHAKDGNKHWARVVSPFPKSLNPLGNVQKEAENDVLRSIDYAREGNSSTHSELDFRSLLGIVKEAHTWASPSTSKGKGNTSARIIQALQALRDSSNQVQPSQLKAIICICIIHLRDFDTDESRTQLLQILCGLLTKPFILALKDVHDLLFAVTAHFITTIPQSDIHAAASSLSNSIRSDEDIRFLLGMRNDPYASIYLRTNASANSSQDPSTMSALAAFNLNSDDPTEPPHILQPFEVKRWDLLPDASSKDGENDTPLGLRLFDAKKVG